MGRPNVQQIFFSLMGINNRFANVISAYQEIGLCFLFLHFNYLESIEQQISSLSVSY